MEFRYIDISAVGTGHLTAEPQTVVFGGAPSRARRLVANGDTIISTVRTYLRAVWPVPGDMTDVVVSTGFAVVSPREVEHRFMAWALQSAGFIDNVVAASNGVSYPAINPSDLGEIHIPIPEPPMQRAIADFLDAETARIDELVDVRRRQLALLDERLLSARSEFVLRGLNPMTGAGCMQSQWRIAKLGVLLTLQRGHDLPMEARQPGSIPVVSSGGVSGWHDVAACDPPGVVTGRYGTVGQVFYVDVAYWPLNTTLYVSDFRNNEPRWVKELLACLPLDAESEKSAVGGINRNIVGDLRVPVPDVADQRQIAAAVHAIERRTERARHTLVRQAALLQEHRIALITAAVTGQLDLARDIAEEAS
jgi:type I restriction enzyme S subunit